MRHAFRCQMLQSLELQNAWLNVVKVPTTPSVARRFIRELQIPTADLSVSHRRMMADDQVISVHRMLPKKGKLVPETVLEL